MYKYDTARQNVQLFVASGVSRVQKSTFLPQRVQEVMCIVGQRHDGRVVLRKPVNRYSDSRLLSPLVSSPNCLLFPAPCPCPLPRSHLFASRTWTVLSNVLCG